MTGPFPFRRELADLDTMLASLGGAGWDGLEGKFAPAKVPDHFDPGDDMKKVLAAFYFTAEGRKIVEWLADLTLRAPYPHVGQASDAVVIAAAKHEARAAVGEVLMKAIAEGYQLLNPRREP